MENDSEAAEVQALIAQAREEARADVTAHLKRLFTDELLSEALRQLSASSPETPSECLVGVVEAGAEPKGADVVNVGRLRALVLEIRADDIDYPKRLEGQMRAHSDLLLAAMKRGPVVPVRFGTFFPSTVDAAGWLERNEPLLHRELERLRNKAEWAVSVVENVPVAAPAATTGAGLPEQREALAGRVQLLHRRLAEIADESRLDGLDGTYLVTASQEERLTTALAETEGLEVRVTGPSPPFSFVSEELF